jgi:hypothetical protein
VITIRWKNAMIVHIFFSVPWKASPKDATHAFQPAFQVPQNVMDAILERTKMKQVIVLSARPDILQTSKI